MITIQKIIPNNSKVKAIGIEIDGRKFIAVQEGSEVNAEFINKVEEGLKNG